MKCWKCSKEIESDLSSCIYCGADQHRNIPSTTEGQALRKIYDAFGCEEVLGNPSYICNGLKDLLPDSEVLCLQIKTAYLVGLGKEYYSQIKLQGQPDAVFHNKVNRLLTKDIGFSVGIADNLVCYFDEMIGWDISFGNERNVVLEPDLNKKQVANTLNILQSSVPKAEPDQCNELNVANHNVEIDYVVRDISNGKSQKRTKRAKRVAGLITVSAILTIIIMRVFTLLVLFYSGELVNLPNKITEEEFLQAVDSSVQSSYEVFEGSVYPYSCDEIEIVRRIDSNTTILLYGFYSFRSEEEAEAFFERVLYEKCEFDSRLLPIRSIRKLGGDKEYVCLNKNDHRNLVDKHRFIPCYRAFCRIGNTVIIVYDNDPSQDEVDAFLDSLELPHDLFSLLNLPI